MQNIVQLRFDREHLRYVSRENFLRIYVVSDFSSVFGRKMSNKVTGFRQQGRPVTVKLNFSLET